MKKNLFLFFGNTLLFFTVLLIVNKVNGVGAVINVIAKTAIWIVLMLSIIGVLIYFVKRFSNISNERYYKKLFNFQLVIYVLVWVFIAYFEVHDLTIDEEPVQIKLDINEKRWDSTYISSHYILDEDERHKEQQAMIKYTGVDTAVFADKCSIGLSAYKVLIDSIGEGQLLQDTSVIQLLGCYIEDDEGRKDKKVHMHFLYKGGSIINGAAMHCDDKKCAIDIIRINDSTVK